MFVAVPKYPWSSRKRATERGGWDPKRLHLRTVHATPPSADPRVHSTTGTLGLALRPFPLSAALQACSPLPLGPPPTPGGDCHQVMVLHCHQVTVPPLGGGGRGVHHSRAANSCIPQLKIFFGACDFLLISCCSWDK